MRRIWILIAVISGVWTSSDVQAFDTCEALFVPAVDLVYDQARIDHIHSEMRAKMGIKISSDVRSLGSMGAGFDAQARRTMMIDRRDDTFIQLINTVHEGVHAQTDSTLRFNPTSPQGNWGISFRSQNKIHKDLPEGYETFFAIDEKKAHAKQTLLLKQLLREYPGQFNGLESHVEISAEETTIFGSVSVELLAKTRDFLKSVDDASLQKAIDVQRYAIDAPGIYVVLLSIPQASATGGKITAGFPINDKFLPKKSWDSKLMRQRLLERCDAALKLLR